MNCLRGVAFSIMIVSAFSCGTPGPETEVPEDLQQFRSLRFEQDLFAPAQSFSVSNLDQLRRKYGSFTDLFAHRIIQIPEGPDSAVAYGIRLFVTDSEMVAVNNRIEAMYSDFSKYDRELAVVLTNYRKNFPEKPMPSVYTFNSAFNYAVITTDSAVGIGLDMFLGADQPQYAALGIPKYMFARFTPDYIVPAVVKGWFQSDYDRSAIKNEMLSQMIYEGKQMYYAKMMAPGVHDSLLTGYTGEQLEWCKDNEAKIWSFFIENKLLFNTDPSTYVKYINEGPSTSGFPKEAPGKIGAWTGWQIVERYMKKNEKVTLTDLLANGDALAILETSGYKPRD